MRIDNPVLRYTNMTVIEFFLEICSFWTLWQLRISLCCTSHLTKRHCILRVT